MQRTFYAAIAEDVTKVYADESLKLLWNKDDCITLFEQSTYNYQYKFLGEDGDNYGGFEKIPPSGFISGNALTYYYAVYPYVKGNKMNNAGNTFTLTLPAEQPYREKSFGIGANTMVAASATDFFQFKNVGGYLAIRLYGENVSVSRITLQGNNHEKIAGKANVSINVQAIPAIIPEVTMDASATESISVVCASPVLLGTSATDYTEFWFVVPPVTFSGGFTITVEDDNGNTFVKSTTQSFTIKRSIKDWMAPLNVVI